MIKIAKYTHSGLEYIYKTPILELREIVKGVNEIVQEQRVRNGDKNSRRS